MNTPLQALQERFEAGERPRFMLFWGHRRRAGTSLDAACLSQWWPAEFELEGQRYSSSEHYMMAEKARLFGDQASLKAILSSASPGAAKALGRTVVGFDEQRWCDERFAIVVRGNLGKFGQNPELSAFLLRSGDKILVEASPIDRVWGIGLSRDDPRASDPRQWQGLNLLGFALMQVRTQLATES